MCFVKVQGRGYNIMKIKVCEKREREQIPFFFLQFVDFFAIIKADREKETVWGVTTSYQYVVV